jgi:hypothetical protein
LMRRRTLFTDVHIAVHAFLPWTLWNIPRLSFPARSLARCP